jgi:hypothetical protein
MTGTASNRCASFTTNTSAGRRRVLHWIRWPAIWLTTGWLALGVSQVDELFPGEQGSSYIGHGSFHPCFIDQFIRLMDAGLCHF